MDTQFLEEAALQQQIAFNSLFRTINKYVPIDSKTHEKLLLDIGLLLQESIRVIDAALAILRDTHILDSAVIQQLKAADVSKVKEQFSKGDSVAEILNIEDDALYQIYEFAMDEFNTGHKNKAETLLAFLVLLNPAIAPFWYGWGACSSINESQTNSIMLFMMAFSLAPTEFKYYFALLRQLLKEGYEQVAHDLKAEYDSTFNEHKQQLLIVELFRKGGVAR